MGLEPLVEFVPNGHVGVGSLRPLGRCVQEIGCDRELRERDDIPYFPVLPTGLIRIPQPPIFPAWRRY